MSFTVSTLDQYLDLPELPIPTEGLSCMVHKIGFYGAYPAECEARGIDAELNVQTDRCMLPTAVVTMDGAKKFFRLPLSLADWALATVAMVHATKNPFPCPVKFGITEDRHYANIC